MTVKLYIFVLYSYVVDQVCARLPIVDVTCEAPKLQQGGEESQGPESDAREYSVRVRLRRIRGGHGSGLPRVYAPKFPKVISLQALPFKRRSSMIDKSFS